MKQAIVVRTDIKMDRGKLAVQVAHAAVSSALKAKDKKKSWFDEWFDFGQKKIVLKVESLKDLQELNKKSGSMNIPRALIRDAGLTQILPGTTTCIGIGPAPDDKIDNLVSDLKLM
ncbi:MAG TPA: peptidyl-tRNA hydrolase [Candidatus Woesearchaeota archaeon]|nr:peptidyl-tRNA hydrolase [Candidatus Woesearchaeota archaeon]